VDTAITPKLFESLGRTLTTVPEGLTIHKTLQRVIDAKKEMFDSGKGFDWATAEALAFGSLVSEGFNVRFRARIPAAAPSASATPSGSTRRTSTSTSR
jgi:2-oxoglutarate dehydrogenase E1 component